MLLSNLDLLATAPGGVAHLRETILTLAVQGKLVPQDPVDEPTSVLLQEIRTEKDRLIAEGKIKQDKSLVEISDEEKPFGLPVGWEWVRALDVCALITDGDHQPPPKADMGVPFLVIGDVRTGFVALEGASRFVPESYFEGLDWGKKPCLGDVLYTTVGSFGIPIPVVQQQRFCFQRHIALFRPAVIELQSYLATALQTKLAFDQAERGATGIAQKTVPLSVLRNLLLPLPPLAEQSRIVTRVEELMRLCDALEAKGRLEAAQHAQLVSTLLGTLTASVTPEELADNWQRVAQHFDLLLDRPEAVDALEQTLLQLAVRGLLVHQDPADEPASALLARIRTEKDRLIAEGKIKRDKPLPPVTDEEKPFELPVGWEWTRMGTVVNGSEAGWSPTCIGSPRRPGHWGVLKVSAVSWGEFDATANKELPLDLAPKPEYEVRDGDFLLSRANTAELVARSVVVTTAEPRLMLSDKVIRLDVSSQMNRVFLNMVNNASHAREHYAMRASGTSSSMKNVSREVVLALPVPLPPFVEQSRIVTCVTALRRLCADLRQRLKAAQATQSHLAQALVESSNAL
ncbi:restriction endonuclease subunit S [Variovorax rhizosphaerae]|uniref:Restriction endonuclease subunit S n=1 Tax=Variovorax rhizosphaerae TaxID=1836200 RepID=A0ABU8WV87_9BURK